MVDREANAIVKVIEVLSGLEDDAVGRVLRWAAERYGVNVKGGSRRPSHEPNEVIGDGMNSDEFEDLASLYAAANPSTESEKVLVVGYWFQVCQKSDDLDSQTLNKELKNLGHGVKNITRALGALIERQPKFVIQTRKSGTAKQARKKYKLTVEGIRSVKQMLTGLASQED